MNRLLDMRSIASVLTNEKIQELQDRLILLQWNESAASEPTLAPIPFVADGYTIPILGATVSDYLPWELIQLVHRSDY